MECIEKPPEVKKYAPTYEERKPLPKLEGTSSQDESKADASSPLSAHRSCFALFRNSCHV